MCYFPFCSVDEEYRRRLLDEEEAGFHPTHQERDGSLGSDYRSNSFGTQENSYQPNAHNDSYLQPVQWTQPLQSQPDQHFDDNGFLPRDSVDGRYFSNRPSGTFNSYEDQSATQPK